MTTDLTLHTIRRWVTDWGFGHAILLNPDDPSAAWAIIDYYGDMSDEYSGLKPHRDVQEWTVVYDPRTPSVYPSYGESDDLPVGTVRRFTDAAHAIKVASGDWLVYLRERLFAVAADAQVASWRVVYVPVEDRRWAVQNGLKLSPLAETHRSVMGRAS